LAIRPRVSMVLTLVNPIMQDKLTRLS
jgi:hypothetical protein